MATCEHPTNTGPCQRSVHDEDARCFMHDGTGTPPRHGAPTGNQNAVGNSGGGAPIGNFNAGVYGAWSDWRKHYDRLIADAKEYVDELTDAYLEKSKADLSNDVLEEKAREAATRSHLWQLAVGHVFEAGWGVEREVELEDRTVIVPKVNPALTAELRHSRRIRKLKHELRTYPSPDGRPWTARSDSPTDWTHEDGEWKPVTRQGHITGLVSEGDGK